MFQKHPFRDFRHLNSGEMIPSEGYCDQPYVAQTDDGAWLCIMTTGAGREGERGQHVVTRRSTDRGRSWEDAVDVEPASGPEASYAVLLKTPGGRIFAFYNHNTDEVAEVQCEAASGRGMMKRVDSLGYFVFKFSDDQGRSWSARRYPIAVREFAVDRENVYGGKIRFFWNVGRPLISRHGVFVTLHKIAAMPFAQSEGAFLFSENLLTEKDPEKIAFQTLPDGDAGLRTPPGGGRIAEEQSVTELSDGSLYCVYRSRDGYPVCSYSRDGGHTWSEPRYKTATPGGRRMKHPRAANFVWRCGNGRFLYWFHNHGGAPLFRDGGDIMGDRNPVWLCAGEEHDSPEGKVLHWSQPEVLLYDDDPFIRISYPDLVEADGRFWISETQKMVARVHEIDPTLVEGLFGQAENRLAAKAGLVLEESRAGKGAWQVPMPKLPIFSGPDFSHEDQRRMDYRAGFTLDFLYQPSALILGEVLLDTRTETGRGLWVAQAEEGALEIRLNDGRSESAWRCDRGSVRAGGSHHVTFIVDGGPKLILCVVDGLLHDGGEERQFGWGRFSPALREANGAPELRLAESVGTVRIYTRALRVSEAVGNARVRSWAGGKISQLPKNSLV